MKNTSNKKMFYLFVACITLSLLIVGVTFAYFTASASNNNVNGSSETVSFRLNVEKITTADMAFGLIPMKNNQAPAAAQNNCYDDRGNAGCQMYKITVNADSDVTMFLDGYISLENKEGVETRMASVYPTEKEEETQYNTAFTPDDFINSDELSNEFLNTNDKGDLGIKTGIRTDIESQTYNQTDDADCLLIKNQQLGGSIGNERTFYVMVRVYDNGHAQDYLQGMQLAYRGTVVFVTAQGNEISATFD